MLLAGKDIVRLVMREAVSCLVIEWQQLSHGQLTLVLSLEDFRGKYKINKSDFLEDFLQSPYYPPLFCTKSVNVLERSPTTGRTNADGRFPSSV